MILRRLIGLMPASLAGQIIVLVAVGTLVSQVILVALFSNDRAARARANAEEAGGERLGQALLLMGEGGAGLPDLMRSLRGPRLQIRPGAPPRHLLAGATADKRAARRLEAQLRAQGLEATSVNAWRTTSRRRRRPRRRGDVPEDAPPPPRRPPLEDRPSVDVLVLNAALAEGTVATAILRLPAFRPWAGTRIIAVTSLTAIILSLVLIGLARRVTRPLDALGAAADRLGDARGHEPLPEEGPQEVRQAIAAFNRMGTRIDQLLEDQRRMVAAVGHDLRTPITALRLRTDFVKDTENRERMHRILTDMEAMTEGLLALARAEAEDEPLRPTDLGALIESLVDDLADLGMAVTFKPPARLVRLCRPQALTRAVRNLAENAARYGHAPRIGLESRGDGTTWITVEDWGPGLDPGALERVFEPFTRLETSRNRETGGMGLGLTIARVMVTKQGGTLTLRNRNDAPGATGLIAEIRLPPANHHGSRAPETQVCP